MGCSATFDADGSFQYFFWSLGQGALRWLPYPVFTFCALIPWQLFAHALTQASNSLVENDRLITKVYFPRLVIPLSSVLAGLVDFVIAFTILVALMAYYGISPTGAVWTVPVFVFLTIVSALAMGLWLSALNVCYRDVRYTLPFITQFWFFISPVAYPSSIVPESWRWFYALNPMVGVIEGFRWALLGKAEAPGLEFVVSSAVAIILFICGLYYFRRMERAFADVV